MRRYNHATRGPGSGAIDHFRNNAAMQIGNPASFLTVHTAPVPALDAYDAWFAGARSSDPRAKPKVDGKIIRRAVILRRNGYSIAETSRALGVNVGHWLAMLPEELAA